MGACERSSYGNEKVIKHQENTIITKVKKILCA